MDKTENTKNFKSQLSKDIKNEKQSQKNLKASNNQRKTKNLNLGVDQIVWSTWTLIIMKANPG